MQFAPITAVISAKGVDGNSCEKMATEEFWRLIRRLVIGSLGYPQIGQFDCDEGWLYGFLTMGPFSSICSIAFWKALINYCSFRYMARARESLTQFMHKMYMDDRVKAYYIFSNLDKKVDNAESRISSDVDQMFQFSLEFFLGGVFPTPATHPS